MTKENQNKRGDTASNVLLTNQLKKDETLAVRWKYLGP